MTFKFFWLDYGLECLFVGVFAWTAWYEDDAVDESFWNGSINVVLHLWLSVAASLTPRIEASSLPVAADTFFQELVAQYTSISLFFFFFLFIQLDPSFVPPPCSIPSSWNLGSHYLL